MKYNAVYRGRAHQDSLRLKNFGNNVIGVGTGTIIQFYSDIAVAFLYATGNGLGHSAGAVPHGIVNDGYLVFLVVAGPFLVLFHNLQGVFSPYDAVTWAYHIYGKAEA